MTSARVAHSTSRRVRLRLPSMKGDVPFFQQLAKSLVQCTGVRDVSVNPTTASVLVHHRGDFDEVVRHAEAQGLFDLAEPEPPVAPLEQLRRAVIRANEALRRESDGVIDFSSLGFVALLTGSGYQLFRGKFLPAGGTMLMQALDLLFGHLERGE